MHRNDLRFYKLDQLLELALILGFNVPLGAQSDIERVKDAILAGYRDLPPFMRAEAHQKQFNRFMGSFK